MKVAVASLREAVIKVLEELPSERVAEVLDFAVFLRQRARAEHQELQPAVKAIPANHLDALTGLVAWGGDALADTECLYYEPASRH